jgi:hypothetical protein
MVGKTNKQIADKRKAMAAERQKMKNNKEQAPPSQNF